MDVTIQIPDERATAYQKEAEARGLTVERWLLDLLDRQAQLGSIAHADSIADLQKTNPKEWARHFRAWADGHNPDIPVLSDEAMSRESIYNDQT